MTKARAVTDRRSPSRVSVSPRGHADLYHSRSTMTLIFAGMTGSASLIGLVSHFLPQVPSAHRTLQLVLAVLGVVFTGLLIVLRRRLGEHAPLWLMHLFIAASVVLICLGSWSAGMSQASIAVTAYFVWVGLFVGSFFSLRAIALHLTWVAAGLSVLLAENGDPTGIAAGLMIFGVVIAASGASYYLSRIFGRLAATDTLTGLPNRQALDAHLDRELARSARYLLPLCVGIIDVDNLKMINDSQGHLAGDAVLRAVALHWKGQLRRTDVLARFGGDEFVALMLECDLEHALQAFHRAHLVGAPPCSVGVAAWRAGDTSESLLARADEALYVAKAAGRNRVEAVVTETPEKLASGPK